MSFATLCCHMVPIGPWCKKKVRWNIRVFAINLISVYWKNCGTPRVTGTYGELWRMSPSTFSLNIFVNLYKFVKLWVNSLYYFLQFETSKFHSLRIKWLWQSDRHRSNLMIPFSLFEYGSIKIAILLQYSIYLLTLVKRYCFGKILRYLSVYTIFHEVCNLLKWKVWFSMKNYIKLHKV